MVRPSCRHLLLVKVLGESMYDPNLCSDRGIRDCLVPFLPQHKLRLSSDSDMAEFIQSGPGGGHLATDLLGICAASNGADSILSSTELGSERHVNRRYCTVCYDWKDKRTPNGTCFNYNTA